MTTATISQLILAEIAKGKSVNDAIDAVLGAGTHGKVVDDLYHALRGEAK